MEIQLSLEFLRVVEQAAVAAARTMGQGDRHTADDVAVEAMRTVMDSAPMDGTIVIGESERDGLPCSISARGWARRTARRMLGIRPWISRWIRSRERTSAPL